MSTVRPNKGGILEKGTYLLDFGTVASDGASATYAATDYNIIEVLDNLDLQGQVQSIKVGGSLVPRHDYSQKTGKATIRIHLPYGGPLTVGKEGLPVKLTRQTWNDLTVSAIVVEAALISRKETGRNGDSVFEEIELDFNPHWLVAAV